MQIYKVTHTVILDIGTIVKLSENQLRARTPSLKKKRGGVYEVIEPVQFKKGEEVTIVSGNVSKAVLKNLREKSAKSKEITDDKQSGGLTDNTNQDINDLPNN